MDAWMDEWMSGSMIKLHFIIKEDIVYRTAVQKMLVTFLYYFFYLNFLFFLIHMTSFISRLQTICDKNSRNHSGKIQAT